MPNASPPLHYGDQPQQFGLLPYQPASTMPYAPLGRDNGRGVSARADGAVFAVAVLALVGLISGNGLGPVLVVIYWGAWLVYGLCHPRLLLMPMHYLLPWLFPIWSLSTTFWSIDPIATVRVTLELMLSTYVALLMANAMTMRGILLSLWAALAISVMAGIIFNKDQVIYATNTAVFTGFFGSKNTFGMFGGLLLITSVAILLDSAERRGIRFVALVLSFASVGVLMSAHSSDATTATIAATLLVIGGSVFARLAPEHRLAWALAGGLCAALGLILILSDWNAAINQALEITGKDSTLTGRVYLWSRAQDIIAAHPYTGVGNQAFWQQGNLDAEGMWAYLKISSRTGITMHSLYYETMLNTGLIGFVIIAGTIVLTGLIATTSYLARAGAWATASVALVAFFAMRAFLETEFLSPFILGSVLFPLIYASAWKNIDTWRIQRLQPDTPDEMVDWPPCGLDALSPRA